MTLAVVRQFSIVALIACSVRAEDARKPHTHQGVFKRHALGPPTQAGLSVVRRGTVKRLIDGERDTKVTSLAASPTAPSGTMRCSSCTKECHRVMV